MQALFPFRSKAAVEPRPAVVPRVSEKLVSETGAAAEPAVPKIISAIADVPKGVFLDLTTLERPLTQQQAETFAVLKDAQVTYVLWDGANRRMMMEVMARLQTSGFVAIQLVATLEVIRAVNQKNDLVTDEPLIETNIQTDSRALILDAEMRGASDLHIETRGEIAEVFYRVHGKRMRMADMSVRSVDAMANYLYNWASRDQQRETSWDKREVQDTNMSFPLADDRGELQIRFHSAPIHPDGNVQIVMRLLRPSKSGGGYRKLDLIGYDKDAMVPQIQKMLSGGSGLVLTVGPTNSGKSSSLQSFVASIRDSRGDTIKIPTIEDPVEYEMVGACQMPASRETFTKFLMASLRQDPDAVVVGEIRGEEAADMVKNIVLAGHKILSTLHVYEAPAAFSRLIQLGVPRGLLAMPGFISGIIFQRLVPVLCPHCSQTLDDAREAGKVSEELERRIQTVTEYGDNIRFQNESGCDQCHFLGIIDRTPCAEVLTPNAHFLELIRKEEDAAAKQYWLTSMGEAIDGRSPTALSHAISKMRQGIVDPRDVEITLSILTAEMGG